MGTNVRAFTRRHADAISARDAAKFAYEWGSNNECVPRCLAYHYPSVHPLRLGLGGAVVRGDVCLDIVLWLSRFLRQILRAA
jgi:hypothetical protein